MLDETALAAASDAPLINSPLSFYTQQTTCISLSLAAHTHHIRLALEQLPAVRSAAIGCRSRLSESHSHMRRSISKDSAYTAGCKDSVKVVAFSFMRLLFVPPTSRVPGVTYPPISGKTDGVPLSFGRIRGTRAYSNVLAWPLRRSKGLGNQNYEVFRSRLKIRAKRRYPGPTSPPWE